MLLPVARSLPLLAALVCGGCNAPRERAAEPPPGEGEARPAESTPRRGEVRPRARQLGVVIGEYPPGPHNAITDVGDVRVGHTTLIEGDRVRTGVTVVLPHAGNVFRDKVRAAIEVHNGFGKLIGYTQVHELGNLESPIALTNTLNVGKVADALVGFMLEQPGNESVRSINVVVGETNDGRLNDIRARHVGAEHVRSALRAARGGAVAEGSVGAGTGTRCLGWKGGIGTSSRRVGDLTVGVLVQTNFGGRLTMDGVPVPRSLRPGSPPPSSPRTPGREQGSCMIVIATDAPLRDRSLHRIARRSFAGMARTGASFSHGSGDYAIAFSVADDRAGAASGRDLSRLFQAVADATEEAILNSMLRATSVRSALGEATALPIEPLRALLAESRGR